MELVVFLIWVAIAVGVSRTKKKNAAGKQERPVRTRTYSRTYSRTYRPEAERHEREEWHVPKPEMPGERPERSGSLEYESTEGEGYIEGDYRIEELTPHSDDHVVRPTSEGGHTHTESSIPQRDACVPDVDRHYEDTEHEQTVMLSLKGDDIRRAVIYSEILGRPKALR